MKFLKASVWLTIITTFILINLGGFVHNTGSSLACPDWPLCYGELIPKMEGGILIEHSHRLLGALVGFFTILISIFTFKNFGNSREFKFSLLSLALVIFQGILGGLTVIYSLPTIVSTAHLGTSMIFLASLIYLLFLFERKSRENEVVDTSEMTWNKSLAFHATLLALMIYSQMILGASMRHLGLGGVCGTGWSNIFSCFDLVSFSKSFFPESSQAKLHIMHRYFAYVLAFYTIYFANQLRVVFTKINGSLSSKIKFKMIALPIVIITQIILGLASVGTNLGVMVTTLHLGGAALLFGTIWKLSLELKEFQKTQTFTKERYDYLSDLFSMSKPRLSLLVIFTAGIGMLLAPGVSDAFSIIRDLFLITSVVAGACTLNCLIEKDIDTKMKRTSLRPLAARRVSATVGGVIGVVLCIFGITGLFFYTNNLTAILGILAAVSYILFYTPMKQITPHAVFVGAIPGALPPLMGYTAVSNELGIIGLILFSVLFVWQLPHFMAISLMYSKDYDQAGIKVFPNVDGKKYTIKRIVSYSVLLIIVSVLPSFLFLTKSHWYLFVSLILGGGSLYLAYQGVNLEKDAHVAKWSKKFFFSTIIYLPLQLGLMISQIS